MTDSNDNPSTTKDRLEAKRAEQAESELMAEMHEAGFENVEDYKAWQELEELRHLTLSLRKQERAASTAARRAAPRASEIVARQKVIEHHFPLAG